MRKTKFTETQIIAMLAQYEKGVKVVDICREHGISLSIFYQSQKKYSGMDASELKRYKEMEAELVQFKRIVADLTLQNRVLNDFIEKKLLGLSISEYLYCAHLRTTKSFETKPRTFIQRLWGTEKKERRQLRYFKHVMQCTVA
jgi:putative transposase